MEKEETGRKEEGKGEGRKDRKRKERALVNKFTNYCN